MSSVVGLHEASDQEIIDKLENAIDRVVKAGGRLVVGVVVTDDGQVCPFYAGDALGMLGAIDAVRHDILKGWDPFEEAD